MFNICEPIGFCSSLRVNYAFEKVIIVLVDFFSLMFTIMTCDWFAFLASNRSIPFESLTALVPFEWLWWQLSNFERINNGKLSRKNEKKKTCLNTYPITYSRCHFDTCFRIFFFNFNILTFATKLQKKCIFHFRNCLVL